MYNPNSISNHSNQASLDELKKVYQRIVVRGKSAPGNGVREHVRRLGIHLNSEHLIGNSSNKTNYKGDTRSRTAPASGLRTRPKSTGTANVEEIVITKLPDCDTRNYELSSRAGSSFKYGSKITQLPSYEEPSQRNVYSPKSRIISLPLRQSERTPLLIAPRPSITHPAQPPRDSAQSRRYNIEQLTHERTRLLRQLSQIQTHRIDRKYFVSGSKCSMENRYSFDEAQLASMLEMSKQNKVTKRSSLRIKSVSFDSDEVHKAKTNVVYSVPIVEAPLNREITETFESEPGKAKAELSNENCVENPAIHNVEIIKNIPAETAERIDNTGSISNENHHKLPVAESVADIQHITTSNHPTDNDTPSEIILTRLPKPLQTVTELNAQTEQDEKIDPITSADTEKYDTLPEHTPSV